MITLITGVPGSGKTYLAVKTLVDKYYVDRKGLYRLKDKDVTIFTNINGFKLEHKDLNEIFKTVPFEQFFTKEYQDKIHLKYPKIVYVLDECQQYIPPRFSNNQVILYFDTHRHYSDNVYLITQDEKKITRTIATLAELEYRAVRSTFSLFGEFKYNIKSGGEIFQREVARKNKRIFNLYTSFQGDGQTVPKSRLGLYIICAIIAFVGFSYYFFYRLKPDNNVSAFSKTQIKPHHVNVTSKQQYNYQSSLPGAEPEPDIFVSEVIINYVYKDDTLWAFQNPVTGTWHFEPNQFPLDVKFYQSNNYTYMICKQSYIDKHTNIQPQPKQNLQQSLSGIPRLYPPGS